MKRTIIIAFIILLITNFKLNAQCEATNQGANTPIAADNSGNSVGLVLLNNNYGLVTNLIVGDTYTISNSTEPPSFPVFCTIRDPSNNSVVEFGAIPITFVATSTSLEIHYFVNNTCNPADFGVLSILIVNDNSLSIEKNQILKKIKVFPNPITNKIKISSQVLLSNIKLYDLYGKKILETEANDRVIEINLSQLKNGMYFLAVTSDSKTYTEKLIKR